MFRIICDLSSGSIELYLTEIRSGLLMFAVCLVGVWQRNFEPVACVCMVRRSENYSVLRPLYRTHTTLDQNYATSEMLM